MGDTYYKMSTSLILGLALPEFQGDSPWTWSYGYHNLPVFYNKFGNLAQIWNPIT